MEYQRVERIAKRMRRKILDIAFSCNLSAHIGGALSIVDITATLYSVILKYDPTKPIWEERDRFILSKGHGALGYYSALLEAGFISEEVFNTFQVNGSDLTAHPVMNLSLGIESSNGSLGHGLSLAVGLALAAKKMEKRHNIYVLLGNGECNEGAVWEAVMAASHFKLDNLTAIVDNNGYQNDSERSKEIMDCGDIGAKWESFGWNLLSVDGHNISQLIDAFVEHNVEHIPKIVVANTIKGKGISFMENNNDWHHNRLTKKYYERALVEMEHGE